MATTTNITDKMSSTVSARKKNSTARLLIRHNPQVALRRDDSPLYALPPMIRTSVISYKP